jgi:hypothetical protein
MAAAALVVGGVVAAILPRALVGVFYDDGIYLALAKSLAQGTGYRLLYLPGAPAAVHYPFGYPAFLALLWTVWPHFPDNVTLLRASNAVLMGVFAALAVGYLAKRLGPPRWVTALVVVAAATAVPLLAVATLLFSEPLFLVLAAGACWAADAARTRAAAGRDRGALGLAVAAGLLAGAAALTRSIGVAVIAGVAVSLALSLRPRLAAAAAIPAALVLGPWLVWAAAHHGGVDPATASNYGTYGDFLRQGGSRWISPASLGDMGRPLAAVFLPPVGGPLRVLLALPVLAVLAAGMAVLARRAPAAGWMLWAYVPIVALWPYGPDRFLWGVLPWLAVAFVAGVHALAMRAAPRRGSRAVAVAAALIVGAGFGTFQVLGFARGGATSAQVSISAAMTEVLPWIRTATDTSAVIAGEDEALIWLYTGRRAVPSFLWRVRGRAAESFGPDTLFAYLERSGATHLVLTGLGAEAAPTVDALLAQRPGYLQLVQVWPGPRYAFRIRRGG